MTKRLLLLILLSSSALADDMSLRDWTVERPATAGVLNGMSVGLYGGFKLGSQSEEASSHDPYGMTTKVRSELVRVGRLPYRIGSAVGYLFSLLVIFGLPFRVLNTLSVSSETRKGFRRVAT